MAELWSDIKLVLTLIFFMYLLKWTSDLTGSKMLGIVLAAVVAYLTFFSHFEILVFVLIFFFGFPFFEKVAEGFEPKKEE